MRHVLVTGGAGYIGSLVALALREAGHAPVVIDNLSTGRRELVPDGVPFIHGDIGDGSAVAEALDRYRCEAVMHFAGSIVVPESVAHPLAYYRNNTAASRTLIETCQRTRVQAFVFSSTAAVYGNPTVAQIDEQTPPRPINPYGRSKLVTEWMLRDAAEANGPRYVALRYFNVAGADPLGRSGQASPKPTHLIKLACETMVGRRPELQVFGTDYNTPDGTCIRDYVHVSDLAQAHVLALDHLLGGGPSCTFNCGYGRGYSVRQVISALERVGKRRIAVSEAGRRPGDPACLVADTRLIRTTLGWTPHFEELETIVGTALEWERRSA